MPALPRCLLSLLAAFLATLACAQTSSDPNEGLRLTKGPTPGTVRMSWFGKVDSTYFIQHSPDLSDGSWSYLPFIEAGASAVVAYDMSSPPAYGRAFYRLQCRPGVSAHPKTEDFDGDHVSNMDELQLGLDPLNGVVDSDEDDLPDDYEWAYLRTLARNIGSDSDSDGMHNGLEFAAGRHPNTSIVYGTTTYTYSGESPSGSVIYMSDFERENSLSVTYADSNRTRVASISVHTDVTALEMAHPEVFPGGVVPLAATYTMTSNTGEAHTLVFTSHTVFHNGVTYAGRDLLRKIDGMPYARKVLTDGTVHRVASYLAITSLPLETTCPTSFPAIIRDFPYASAVFPDFGTAQGGGSRTGYVESMLGADRLPISTLTHEGFSFQRIYSAESFAAWYRKPDAASVNLVLKDGYSFVDGFHYGFWEPDFYPFTDYLKCVGGDSNKFATTRELHTKLSYDISATSENPTRLFYRSDDDIWIFVNGRLVAEDVGLNGGEGDFLLRDTAHGLPAETGICDLVIFSAERLEANGNLLFMSSTPLAPIYAHQILADTWADGPVHYDLAPGAPAGMTIDPNSGKLFWDHSGLAVGTYRATVRVKDSRMNDDAQTIEILLGAKPAITLQPGIEHEVIPVPTGGSTVLSAEASGTPSPDYQWYYGDDPIPGATSATLTLENVDYGDSGGYYVRASNIFGAVISVDVIVYVFE